MFLGIDIGTSAVKAVVMDAGGAIVASASAPLAISRPAPAWSEQEPDDWWHATLAAAAAIDAGLRHRVTAVGLSGQMHGAVLLGDDDRPLRPAILWNDGRSVTECTALEAAVPVSRSITGNLAMPGFTAPKLLWVRRHEPEIFDAVRCVLLPKDYIRLRLTGERVSEMSDASGTLWLDLAARAWSPAMLAASGLEPSHMPGLIEGSTVSGMLTADAAAGLGTPRVPVAGGGGDNAAAAVGMGCVDDGSGFLSLGTSGVLFIATAAPRPHPDRAVHVFCHAIPDRWHQMAVILSAASSVEWVAGVAGFADVATAVAAAEAGAGRATPVFLPYLSGERTPHNDANARGAFVGLDHDTDGAALVRAALEGVGFALADGADALRSAGTNFTSLDLVGGGAQSRWWGRMLATILDCTLDLREGAAAGPALGAARLAALAIGADPATHAVATRADRQFHAH